MSVYVDQAKNRFGLMVMCHLLADTEAELHAMADSIGIQRKWFQTSERTVPHYDICMSKRKYAISLGAIEIDRKKTVELIQKHRNETTPIH